MSCTGPLTKTYVRHNGSHLSLRDMVPNPTLYDPRTDPRYDDNGVLKDITGDDPLMDLYPWYDMVEDRIDYDCGRVYHPVDMTLDTVNVCVHTVRSRIKDPSIFQCSYLVAPHPLIDHHYCVLPISSIDETTLEFFTDDDRRHIVFSWAPVIMLLLLNHIYGPNFDTVQQWRYARQCPSQSIRDTMATLFKGG